MITPVLFVNWTAWPLLIIAIVLVVIRVIIGPTVSDRVVAIDMLSSMATAVIGIYVFLTGDEALLDIALVLALISFLGTVAFGYFLEKNR